MFDFDFQSVPWSTYNPGLLEQDIMTLPLEGGLIAAMNASYARHNSTLWPFGNETTDKERLPSIHPGTTLVLVAAPLATGTLGGLSLFQKDFPVWPHLRGWMHAHLVTEVATTFAKTTFLRERPYHDSELQKTGRVAYDNRLSFISGHASHSFAFATYSSALMWQYSNSKPLNWAFSSLLFAGATWVAAGRVQDHHHNPTDVAAGALVGTAVTYFMFERVVDVIQLDAERKASNKTPSAASRTKVRLFPSFEGFSSQSKIALHAEARF